MKTMAVCALLACGLVVGFAQSPGNHSRRPIARIAYENNFIVSSREWKSPHICFALYGRGYYRLSRLTEFDGWEELHGKLGNADFKALQSMMHQIEFPSRGGMVRGGAERFMAEIERGGNIQRFSWLNPDHQRPLPAPAAEAVRWLQDFMPDNTSDPTWHDLSDEPICPAGEALPLHPEAHS